jgi:hypothetical protein
MIQKSKAGPSRTAKLSSRTKSDSQAPPVDEREQDFWNTPGAAARTLHFTGDLLTDEQIDIGELSGSLESPVSCAPKPRGATSRALQFTMRSRETSVTPKPVKPLPRHLVEESKEEPPVSPGEEGDEDDEDTTVMLKKPPPAESSGQKAEVQSPPATELPRAAPVKPEEASRRGKVKTTMELENIVVGDNTPNFLPKMLMMCSF